jgi:hypothetical protein
MSENKNIFLDKLLSETKSLKDSVLEIKNSDSMPFSFFRESFERTQEISNLLHKLEFLQIDDMKRQMEKLVFFLSESEKKGKVQEIELEKARENERELTRDLEKEKYRESEQQQQERDVVTIGVNEEQVQNRNVYTEGFVLPEYRNPHTTDFVVKVNSHKNDYEAIIDIKRGVSLNDRFIFQRELFNNSRNDMNSTLEKLNSLRSYQEAYKYIRDNFTWDFENQIVNDFLSAVKKGFK